jgi:hypothetical protein
MAVLMNDPASSNQPARNSPTKGSATREPLPSGAPTSEAPPIRPLTSEVADEQRNDAERTAPDGIVAEQAAREELPGEHDASQRATDGTAGGRDAREGVFWCEFSRSTPDLAV